MKNRIMSVILFGAVAAFVSAEEFEISWHTIDSGGVMRSTGGDFELSGTIGQPDAGSMAGGGFGLNGGFWFELPPGDCVEDGAVNLTDYEVFTECFSGPAAGVLSGCDCFDTNQSGHIDMRDFALASNNYSGN
jgi:hypothetical protein